MLVLLVVEVFEVEEVGLLGSLDCSQAVHDGDGVHRHSIGSISVKEGSGCSTAVELGHHDQEVKGLYPTRNCLVSLSISLGPSGPLLKFLQNACLVVTA